MTQIRTVLGGWLVVFSAVLTVGIPERLAAEDNGRSASPDILLEMAYAAEVSGQATLRAALLDQVLARDPENEKARWLTGQVRNGADWESVAAVEQGRAKDEVLQEYVQKRETCGDDAVSRLRLANWCRDHAMPDREKLHLMELVAGSSAGEPAVMARLGMVKFRDQWMAKEAVEEYRQLDDEQRRLEKKWRPTFARWKDDLASGDEAACARLAESLKEVTEVDALPLLEEMLSTYSERAALAIVAYLDTQSKQEATESLVRHAVFSEFEPVRVAAAEALKKRPKYNCIPLLLEGLVAPLEVTIELPDVGTNYVRRTVVQRGRDFDLKTVDHQSQYAVAVSVVGARVTTATLAPKLPLGLKPGNYVEAGTERMRRNEQIGRTLYLLTGESYDAPEEWRNWWNDYSEYECEGEKPTYEQHTHRHFWAYSLSIRRGVSCLAWGTWIATETGSRPVEQILPGDKVLAQDPDTGKLEYKVVLQRTVRRLGEMRRISIGDDSVTVTLGHPFWVVGQGWRMAKELEVGSRVRCLDGSLEVTAIEELPEDVAYNLIVDGFGTYFAGASRVLLHDNTMPKPTDAVLPGYAAKSQ